jgi:signal transduction histidine kinase/CheY-like chemotaxis protein/HPt (histidine-containing phosphotransfer) domain-containing protein
MVYVAFEATVHLSSIARELSHKAEHVAKHAGAPLAAHDILAVRRELALWSIHEDVTAAAIYDADDNLVAHYVSADTSATLAQRKLSPGISFLDGRVTEIVPILLRDRQVGSVSLSRSLSSVYEHVISIVLVGALVMTAAFTWAFLLALRFERRIAVRVRNFIGAAKAASRENDYSLRIERDEADELSELTDPFNAILEHAETKNRELIKAKEAAEAAARAKSDFMNNMSHEIRTPMTSVIGITDLLSTTELTPKQRAYVENIRGSGDVLLSVIDDILSFSKIEAGEIVLEHVDFAVDDVVESVLNMLGYRAYSKDIELACLVEAGAATHVTGDSYRLREVLINLVDNAIKFTERGEVVIRVTKRTETDNSVLVRFSVQDSGIGISPDEKNRLFRPFGQVDESTTRRFGGSGLGLVICRRLVEAMGGAIDFESEAGKGSTFWFEVPLQKQKAPGGRTVEKEPDLQDQRVLVVDDNPSVRECLCHSVASWGMRPDPAPGAHEAQRSLWRATAEGDPYRFVLIDAGLPGMDGLSLARQIKTDPDSGSPRLILLASVVRPIDDVVLDQVGDLTCVQKPIAPSRLHSCLMGTSGGEALIAAEPTSDQPTATTATPAGTAGSKAARILVAEDNPLNKEMLLDMLHLLGYRARAVDDGLGVLPAMEASAYDIVLLDCQMPGKDGYQVAAEIRDREGRDKRTVIIAITASAVIDGGTRARCLDAGMDDFVGKPVHLEQLAAMLERWLPVAAERDAETEGDVENHRGGDAPLDPQRWAYLRTAAGADRAAFVDKYIDLFVNDAERRLQALRAALHTRQADLLAREAHALKAGCLQIGASAMVELCKELQKTGRAESLEGVDITLNRLDEEFNRTKEALAAEQEKSV